MSTALGNTRSRAAVPSSSDVGNIAARNACLWRAADATHRSWCGRQPGTDPARCGGNGCAAGRRTTRSGPFSGPTCTSQPIPAASPTLVACPSDAASAAAGHAASLVAEPGPRRAQFDHAGARLRSRSRRPRDGSRQADPGHRRACRRVQQHRLVREWGGPGRRSYHMDVRMPADLAPGRWLLVVDVKGVASDPTPVEIVSARPFVLSQDCPGTPASRTARCG